MTSYSRDQTQWTNSDFPNQGGLNAAFCARKAAQYLDAAATYAKADDLRNLHGRFIQLGTAWQTQAELALRISELPAAGPLTES
jgi:hypothetical protein